MPINAKRDKRGKEMHDGIKRFRFLKLAPSEKVGLVVCALCLWYAK